jgi:hypothetical protein
MQAEGHLVALAAQLQPVAQAIAGLGAREDDSALLRAAAQALKELGA